MVKVAFIICYNNELYMRECMDYISWLKVPEGVETEIIGITEAESMAAGYNAAMHESDAKYKVYLHQDVFILNEDFIQDIINIFEENTEYGMLGVMGSTAMVSDANYWLKWDTGAVYADDTMTVGVIEKANPEKISETIAIDGMIMITQYDVEWREDIFDGFDFYDVSQSMEFKKAGYKIGVPHQDKPWCNHVCGHSKMGRYDVYRKKFCEEYGGFGYFYIPNAEIEDGSIKNKEIEKILPLIEEAMEKRDLGKTITLLNTAMQFYPYNSKLCNLYVITQIMQMEMNKNIQNGFCTRELSVEKLLEKYSLCKFLLKRLEHNKPTKELEWILDVLAEREPAGLEAEKLIAEHAVTNVRKVICGVKRKLQQRCGRYDDVRVEDMEFVVPNEEACEEALLVCKNIESLIIRLKKAEGIENNIYLQMLDILLETMESVSERTHIGKVNEALYMAYFAAIENLENAEKFLELCQEWQEGILQYINREERQPLVSVLLSVYNGEKFVEDTLDSIIHQSYKNLQIVVVNDCSTDGSQQIIDKFAQNDKRIVTLCTKENSNVCKAINLAYQTARGKYVAVIGHDDIWKLDKIEKQVCFMEMYPKYAACFTLVDIINDEGKICNEKEAILYGIFDQRNCSRKGWINKLLFEQNIFCAPSVLIRRKCIAGENIYHYGIVQLQDMALWLELLRDYPVYILQERLTLYRKFSNVSTNLSTFSETTRNRLRHEGTYIVADYIRKLPDEKFRFYLKEHFRDKKAEKESELKCERAFIMQDLGDLHCIEMFFELYDEEDTRRVLEEKYQFKLKDFYILNAKTFSYDDGNYYQLLNAHEVIHQYETVVERQRQIIEKQLKLLEENNKGELVCKL